jgi:hypothetical protein
MMGDVAFILYVPHDNSPDTPDNPYSLLPLVRPQRLPPLYHQLALPLTTPRFYTSWMVITLGGSQVLGTTAPRLRGEK